MRAHSLLIALCIASSLGCDQKKTFDPRDLPKEPPASPSAIASALGIDAGGLVDTTDPPPPAGDLKADLDHFVNVETCVKQRANVDPLVGDGLRAIGYDTFLLDACRLLEAAKDQKPETCEKIDASPMRARCRSWVAMVTQSPDSCPLQFDGVPTRGRNLTCVAVAGKDPRLCTAEPRAVARATCEALVAKDDAKCAGLLPNEKASCVREITRWRSLLAAPLAGLAPLPPSRGKLTVKGETGTTDPGTPESDLATELARGVVVVTSRDRARVELGMIGESETSRIAPSPNRRPRVGLAVLFDLAATAKDTPKAALERMELEIPGQASLVYPGAACDCKVTTSRVDRKRAGEFALTLSGTISADGHAYRIEVDLATWVRDVVNEPSILGASGGARVVSRRAPRRPRRHPLARQRRLLSRGLFESERIGRRGRRGRRAETQRFGGESRSPIRSARLRIPETLLPAVHAAVPGATLSRDSGVF